MDISKITIGETEDYVVINKPATASSVHDKTDTHSIQFWLEEKYKRPIYPITRLDKVVSGACLYALSKEGAAKLTDMLSSREIKKHYLAIVEGKIAKKEETLVHYLRKKGAKARVYEEEQSNTKKATLYFKRKKVLENYTTVEVELITGRFHQIRAQFSDYGTPIKGDVKYGARRKNRDRSIYLHSWKLQVGDQLYVARVPEEDRLWQLL